MDIILFMDIISSEQVFKQTTGPSTRSDFLLQDLQSMLPKSLDPIVFWMLLEGGQDPCAGAEVHKFLFGFRVF